MLIVLEGVDKLGKTTLAEKLRTYYSLFGYNVKVLSPFTTYMGQHLRPVICSPMVDNHSRLILIREAMKYLMEAYLDPLLKDKNNIVILDRFVLSTMAYQDDHRGFIQEHAIIEKYRKIMVTALLTCDNKDFIINKIEKTDSLEQKVLKEFDEIQRKYREKLRNFNYFQPDKQMKEFAIKDKYVDFSEVLEFVEEWRAILGGKRRFDWRL